MKRLTLDVPRWHIYKHRDARGLETVDADDTKVRKFEDELFDRLYSNEVESLPADKQDKQLAGWAEKVHEQCKKLPSFERLVRDVQGEAALAGYAVDCIMQDLMPLLKSEEDRVKEAAKQNAQQGTPANGPGQTPGMGPKLEEALRRAVTKATTAATQKIEEIKEADEALEMVGLGGWKPGTEKGEHSKQDGQRIRALATQIKDKPAIKRFIDLVGRFKRIAQQKQKQKVNHGADEITDITTGSDLNRLLPSETMMLANKTTKLELFRKITENACLQYHMTGIEPKGKGPIVVCIDKSGSMNGQPDEWATAIALALGDMALRQKRVFAMVSFDTTILHECVVKPGEAIPEDCLMTDCQGGTDIDVAYARAVAIIKDNPGQLNKADIVMITDGGSHQRPDHDALRAKAKEMGVNSLGIGIFVPADCLKPWCETVQSVTDISKLDEELATKLFAN